MIKVSVMNRQQAELFQFSPDAYVISITRAENTPAKIAGTKNVLYLFFDDNETDFNANHAKQILAFITRIGTNGRLYVHCDAGISRSAGVVDFLNSYLGFIWARLDGSVYYGNEWRQQYKPNVHVKSTLRRVYSGLEE